MRYDPMHAMNYVNWFMGSNAGINDKQLEKHIKEANYKYAENSSRTPEEYYAYCDSVILDSKNLFKKCHNKGLSEEQFKVCLVQITSIYDYYNRNNTWRDIQKIVSQGNKPVKSYMNQCKKELIDHSSWEDISVKSKGNLWMALYVNNKAIIEMQQGNLLNTSEYYKQASDYYLKAGYKGHYHKTLALYFDNLARHEHSNTDHYSDPDIYIKLDKYCKKARKNYAKALTFDKEKLPLPAEMSFYTGNGNPDVSGEIEYQCLTGMETSVINSNSWAIAADSYSIRANNANHYALHKMQGEKQTEGLFVAAFHSLPAAHCSLFASSYSQHFSESSKLERISAYFTKLADYYWYKAEALLTDDKIRESIYNLEIAKEHIDEAIQYYTNAAFGGTSDEQSFKAHHDDYARKKIAQFRDISHRLGADIFKGRSKADTDIPVGNGKPTLVLNYEYSGKPTKGDLCKIKFDLANLGTPVSNVSAELKNGTYHLEGLELPIQYPPIKVAKMLDKEKSYNAITAIYDGEKPIFRLKYEFEGETVNIIINNN